MTPHDLLPPRDEILHYIERIYRLRMTTTSGGNLSLREADGTVWITPARLDKGTLHRDDIVAVRPDNTVAVRPDGSSQERRAGTRRPSSELPFHKAIYAARPDVGAIVHAHPVALVAFSLCRRTPQTRLFHQAWHICGEVGFAPYALPGSERLGENIAATFAAGHDCVVLENHGVVTAGPTLAEAFARFETLEFVAKMQIKAALLGETQPLTDGQLQASDRAARSLPTAEPTPPDTAEKEARRQLAQFVQRGYRQRLLISTEGSFSTRLGDDAFLVTPTSRDRGLTEPGDLVAVRDGRAEPNRTPSRAAGLHRAIYRQHPWAGAVVNAFPVNATAFSMTGRLPDLRAIPESYVVLRGITQIPFGAQFHNPDAVAAAVGIEQPAAVLENDGVLVLGRDMLEAFDRLEVLEATAEALINAGPLGGLVPMDAAAMAELHAAFFGA